MNSTVRPKKVYHLRKTVSSLRNKQKNDDQKYGKQQNSLRPQNQVISSQVIQNNSLYRKNPKENIQQDNYTIKEENTRRQVDGPQLIVNTLFLDFQEKLNSIIHQQIKVKNIGSSAIYYQWKFQNQNKINPYALKDTKAKFFCHYSKNSINPGEQITFLFSFVSQIPGYFTQQCTLLCQPALNTPIPTIKLQGKAYIDDQWKEQRSCFLQQLQDSARLCSVSQTLDDLVDQIKLPQPERPNVKDPKIAQQIFQKINENKRLYFNPYLHKWFNELYQQVWQKQGNSDEFYWDQSIQSFSSMINNCKCLDDVQKKCFLQRLSHYVHLSTFPLPSKSLLYPTVYKIISDAVYLLGGQHNDTVRKQLDMWQTTFRQPTDNEEEDLKLKKDQIDKVKAQWLKRTKKKKWGEEEDKQIMEEYRMKLRAKTTNQILTQFTGFQQQAEFTKVKTTLESNSFNKDDYFLFLQRLKTVKESSLQGKKVLLKFNLKLKDNCQKQLQELNDYLIKKEDQKNKMQQQKKNTDSKKKKAPKKKGQKQEQQQKPLSFDFSSILQEQNWLGFLQTFKTIQQKSPFMILLGCTYGPRSGYVSQKFSTKFLLQHLRVSQPSIQFMPHSNLFQLHQNIQSQSISQGSIFLLENLNFLIGQTMIQVVEDKDENGQIKETKRNVLFCQISGDLDRWMGQVDVVVDQDRQIGIPSGVSTYANRQVVLGNTWWNYVGLITRIQGQTVILGGDFNPQSLLLLQRLIQYTRKIYLTGLIGVKFSLVLNKIKSRQYSKIVITQIQQQLINSIISVCPSSQLTIPCSFKLINSTTQQLLDHTIVQGAPIQHQLLDINQQITNDLIQTSGHLFVIGDCRVKNYDQEKYGVSSMGQLVKGLFRIQENKRARHANQLNTLNGIEYQQDLVVYFVGINHQYVQQLELKDKKVQIKSTSQQGQQLQEEPENQEEPVEKKKIDLVADFKLNSQKTVRKLLCGQFDIGLKNIIKYPKPRQI